MRKLLTILSFLFSVITHAQMISMMNDNTINATRFGALLAGNSMSHDRKLVVTRDSLKLKYYRTVITVMSWNGSAAAYADADAAGLGQFVNFTAWPTGTSHAFVTAAQRAQYKTNVTAILNKYPHIKYVVVDNEPQTDGYHSGPLTDYGENQLKATYEVCHPRGVYVIDGGVIDGAGLRMRTYSYVKEKYGLAAANAYANTVLTSAQKSAADNPGSNPTLDALAEMVDVLASYSAYEDFVNMHLYDPTTIATNQANQTVTTTNLIRYQAEYLIAAFHHPIITNECGQRNNFQPAMSVSIVREFYRCGFYGVFWWSNSDPDNVGGIGATSLTTTNGTLLDNGKSFRDFVKVHQL